MNERIDEVTEMIKNCDGMWYESIKKVLSRIPEFHPPTWNDPKVSQPDKGKWFVINPFGGKLFINEHAYYLWHYVTIAPIPEPESELCKTIRDYMDNQIVTKDGICRIIKEFESKK